jgi:PadR family transcriptional regulator, regulatory protein PadR
MEIKNDNPTRAQLRKGVLEMCILAVIAQEEQAYPSEIIRKLKDADIIVVEGTLYPILTRLKNSGLLAYTWEESRQGPPRKYFRITEEGKKSFFEMLEDWKLLVSSVDSLTQIKTKNNE